MAHIKGPACTIALAAVQGELCKSRLRFLQLNNVL